MSLFSDRRYDVLVNGKPIIKNEGGKDHQLRVVFQISISFNGSFSHGDIALYNLAPNTIEKFMAPNAVVALSAGYVGNQDIIFSGGIRHVLFEREGASTITRILATSGTVNNIELNHTMPTGSTIPQTIRKIGELMSLGVVMNDASFDSEPAYERKSLQGVATQVLRQMGYAHDFGVIEENGKLVVLKNGTVRDHQKFQISQATGMEGIPEYSQVGCDVAIRINPKILMGSQITVESQLKAFNMSNMYYTPSDESLGVGIYTIRKMDHSGDSWGDAWTTKITGFRFSA